MVAGATDAYLSECRGPWPKISVTCPAIVRLIQIRYPDLLDHLVPIETPRELAAKLLRRRLAAELQARARGDRHLLHHAVHRDHELDPAPGRARPVVPRRRVRDQRALRPGAQGDQAGTAAWTSTRRGEPAGLLWAMAGGEIAGMRNANTMTVRGVRDVQYVFDRHRGRQVPERRLHRGVHLSRRLRQRRPHRRRTLHGRPRHPEAGAARRRAAADGQGGEGARPAARALLRPGGGDRRAADPAARHRTCARPSRWKREQAGLLDRLPRRDCAACGAPDCATLAEDVLRGEATLDDCVFLRIDRLEGRAAPEGGNR